MFSTWLNFCRFTLHSATWRTHSSSAATKKAELTGKTTQDTFEIVSNGTLLAFLRGSPSCLRNEITAKFSISKFYIRLNRMEYTKTFAFYLARITKNKKGRLLSMGYFYLYWKNLVPLRLRRHSLIVVLLVARRLSGIRQRNHVAVPRSHCRQCVRSHKSDSGAVKLAILAIILRPFSFKMRAK